MIFKPSRKLSNSSYAMGWKMDKKITSNGTLIMLKMRNCNRNDKKINSNDNNISWDNKNINRNGTGE